MAEQAAGPPLGFYQTKAQKAESIPMKTDPSAAQITSSRPKGFVSIESFSDKKPNPLPYRREVA